MTGEDVISLEEAIRAVREWLREGVTPHRAWTVMASDGNEAALVCAIDQVVSALAGPVPWAARACRDTATVHLGGTLEEIASSEADIAAGRHPQHRIPRCYIPLRREYCIGPKPIQSDLPGGQELCDRRPFGDRKVLDDRFDAEILYAPRR